MLVLTDIQEVELSVEAKTAAGNPATVQDPTWGSSDDTVLVVTADATDPMKAKAVTTGKLGTAQARLQCDADLGDGVKPLNALLDIEVIASEAASLAITAGTPTDK